MTDLDPFAFGGVQDDDAAILSLFREWCAAYRASCADSLTDDELDAAVDVTTLLAGRIYDAPVQGVVGLAIKAFMAADEDGLKKHPDADPCARGAYVDGAYACRFENGQYAEVRHLYMRAHALRGLLASAAAFVPELQPLVARMVESPLTLPLK